ncbi:hypothetical protein BDN72DRAFT_964513 [Pluteus cervinus]|uniref:Uncharacterized protein n=1 Tax=Pluteus cervinus TaxID=181527 RepID=A0ACD3A9G2_9AGAR|nr:hypothetical protein BDN72DRAFT_964513 [Pluteus cervinus]
MPLVVPSVLGCREKGINTLDNGRRRLHQPPELRTKQTVMSGQGNHGSASSTSNPTNGGQAVTSNAQINPSINQGNVGGQAGSATSTVSNQAPNPGNTAPQEPIDQQLAQGQDQDRTNDYSTNPWMPWELELNWILASSVDGIPGKMESVVPIEGPHSRID